jgi:hypothetical protein
MPNTIIINAVRNALLFSADKYRKASDIVERFIDDTRAYELKETERGYRAVAEVTSELATLSTEQKALCIKAVVACADDLNRKVQLLSDRYQTEAASLTSLRLREVYQALDYLEGRAPGESEAAAATAAAADADSVGTEGSGEA